MTDSEININPEIKQIILSRGHVALVDAIDYDFLNQWKWSYSKLGYAVRKSTIMDKKQGMKDSLRMHREVMKCPDNMQVDHINNFKLDNRKCNLRICTAPQNCWNIPKTKNRSSKYKGVSWHKKANKWAAKITCKGESIWLGIFGSEEDAANAYNEKAQELHGEYAKLNIIE